eukprot:scaffold723_cov370-Pinguiococcus_pyrenoidosus.AAC.4
MSVRKPVDHSQTVAVCEYLKEEHRKDAACAPRRCASACAATSVVGRVSSEGTSDAVGEAKERCYGRLLQLERTGCAYASRAVLLKDTSHISGGMASRGFRLRTCVRCEYLMMRRMGEHGLFKD